MDLPNPSQVHTRQRMRECLAQVRAASGMSLQQVVDGSQRLVHTYRTHRKPWGWTPVALTKQNISAFSTGKGDQLPGEAALLTFLHVCARVPPGQMPQWRAALARARKTPSAGPPSHLPRLPDHFVPRPEEREQVLEELRALAGGGGAVALASTAALHGTGGFGKTTLALEVCLQEEIRDLFPDGVVWVEIGQEPVLTSLLADVTARVSREPLVRYGSVEAAAAALAEALVDRRLLLVLDNAWRVGDLEPFLRGGAKCVRLVTSRRWDVLPVGAKRVTVGRMAPEQAVSLLAAGVAGASSEALYPLYACSHRWPVVLGILNGVLRARTSRVPSQLLEEVVAQLVGRLQSKGLAGADGLAAPEQRTVQEVLAIGMEELAADTQGHELRSHFLSLAAFPPDQLIGFGVLAELWGGDMLEVHTVCERLADRSLLGSVEQTGVRLHDVIRDHIVSGYHPEVQQWAERLWETARGHCTDGRWDLIASEHADDLDWLAFLMVFTNREEELREILWDLRFLARRLQQGGIAGVSDDILVCEVARGRDPQLQALERVLRLEGHLAPHGLGIPDIAATLWSRLVGAPVVRDRVTHRGEALRGALTALGPMPDRPDGRLAYVCSGHSGRVIALAWQPDGEKLATGTADGTVRIWDVAGTVLRTVVTDSAVNALAWSPDLLHLAALVDNTVWLIEPILGEVTLRRRAGRELTCLAWTDQGLAVAGADGTAEIWDTGAAAPRRLRTSSSAAVRAMEWAGEEVGLVTVHSDGVVARAGREAQEGAASGLNVPRALAVRPYRPEVVVGGAERQLVLVDMAASPPQVRATSEPVAEWVTSAGFSSDGQWLAAGLKSGAAALWSTGREDGVHTLRDDPLGGAWEAVFAAQPLLDHHGKQVEALGWHPRLPLLAVGAHQEARVFDLRRMPTPQQNAGVNCLACHPQRGLFAMGGVDGEVVLADGSSPENRHTLEAYQDEVRAVAFSPDGNRLLSVSEQGPLLLWDITGGAEGPVPTAVDCPVQHAQSIAWSPDGSAVAVGGERKVVVLEGHRLTARSVFDVPQLVTGLAFDPSGTRLAVATTGADIWLHSLHDAEAQRLSAHMNGVTAVHWAGSDHLVSAGLDGQVIVWSIPENSEATAVRKTGMGSDRVWGLAVSPSALVAVTSSGRIGLQPLHGDGPSCTVFLETALGSCGILADGMTLVVGGAAGTARFTLPSWATALPDP